MKVRPKTIARDAWQFDVLDRVPTWVKECTKVLADGLYLVRRSGKQRIMPGEWLVQDLDGEPLWFTDVAFRSEYEFV